MQQLTQCVCRMPHFNDVLVGLDRFFVHPVSCPARPAGRGKSTDEPDLTDVGATSAGQVTRLFFASKVLALKIPGNRILAVTIAVAIALDAKAPAQFTSLFVPQ